PVTRRRMHPARARTALAVLFFAGCFASPFFRNGGPAQAEGVTVSLVDQGCAVEPDLDNAREDGSYPERLDLGMRISVQDGTRQEMTIDSSTLRLVSTEAADAPVSSVPPQKLAPGETKVITVRFRHLGALGCDAPMSLALDKFVQMAAHPIPLKPVTFVAAETSKK